MAEAVILATSGWVASPLVKLLVDKALGYLDTNDERREKLAATVIPRLSLAIEKAEQSPNKKEIEEWLKRLKHAYYKAEEVIDEFEYEELEKRVKDDRRTLEQKVKNERGNQSSVMPKFNWNKLKLSRQLKDRIDKLIKIAQEADEFHALLEKIDEPDRETHSKPLGRIFGRESDIEKVVDLLNKKPSNSEPGPSNRQPIHVIAITGRSGIGKTELAKAVSEYMKTEKHFNLFIWVRVPRIFKATEVLKKIINLIQAKEHDLHVGNHDPKVALAVLEEQITQLTGSKKILLFLDDFWCDYEGFGVQWENFISCLGNWLPGSKILLTTQFHNVARNTTVNGLTKLETYNLQELKESPLFELFMHHAWPSDRSDPERRNYEEIARKIAGKLKGDPGAAKQIGKKLICENLSDWKNTSEESWLGDSSKARIWSYQQLPTHLQRCFSILSIFPKDTKFNVETLISLWLAEGFIPLKSDGQSTEDIARSYIHELVSRFFLEEHTEEGDKNKYYQLHDLLHDLAERVQGDDFIRIDPDNCNKITLHNTGKKKHIRHVYLYLSVNFVDMRNELKDAIFSMKNLRTLIIVEEHLGNLSKEVLQKILENSKTLRYLSLVRYGNDFPENVGNLKHLRQLEISGSSPLKKLPNSICKLYHLQVLYSPSCETVPKKFSELVSLRRFNLKEEIMPHISDIGRLASLQSLSRFVVSTDQGHKLHQLEKLNQLQGTMRISDLQNVENIADAVMAKMKEKKYLQELEFEWDPNGKRATNAFQLLDALQPHPNISSLRISKYGGNKFPNWLLCHNSLRHLKSLTLEYCFEVEEIPSIHESIPNCRILNLLFLRRLKEFPVLPLNLTKLVVNWIPKLSYFSEDESLMKNEIKQYVLEVVNEQAEHFKSKDVVRLDKHIKFSITRFIHYVSTASDFELQDNFWMIYEDEPWKDDNSRQILDLWVRCTDHHLKTIFDKTEKSQLVLPRSLTSLEITYCSITSDALSTCLQSLDSLSELTLCEIQTITSLPSQELLCALKNLRSLTIQGCFLLQSLGGIAALTSLIRLTIEHCINLNVSYESLPSSLEEMHMIYSTIKVDVSPMSRLKKLTIQAPWDEGPLKGLNSLTELFDIWVEADNNEISTSSTYSSHLEWFTTDNPLLLTQMLSDTAISSLNKLSIRNWLQPVDDEVFGSLLSLKHLFIIRCNNITRMPLRLKNLASLHYVTLEDCPKLELDLEDLPESLLSLSFRGDCPILTEKFSKGGPYRVHIEKGKTWIFPQKEEGNIFRLDKFDHSSAFWNFYSAISLYLSNCRTFSTSQTPHPSS